MGGWGASIRLLLGVAILGLSLQGRTNSVHSADTDERIFLDTSLRLVDAERKALSINSLARDQFLDQVALKQAEAMSQARRLFHNPVLSNDVGTALGPVNLMGENVGFSPDATKLHAALMRSPSHRANILRGNYDSIGIGLQVGADGRTYVAQVFADREADSN